MNALDQSNAKYFLWRFYDCDDGVIRSIAMTSRRGVVAAAKAVLSVQDRENATDDGWVNLLISIDGVVETTIVNPEAHVGEVLSNGIKIGFFEGFLFLDMDPYTDEPEGVDDFRRSPCLIVGKTCLWDTHVYSKNA